MIRELVLTALVLSISASSSFAASSPATPPPTVAHVDAARFMGTWYEIAVIPYFWELACQATRATYTLRPDGKVDVLNRCHVGTVRGPEISAHGQATVTDPGVNAKLRVGFFGNVTAPYWIIGLDEGYQYAMTASPNRDYLWILSRTPAMDESVYQGLVKRAAELGYPVKKLRRVKQ